MAESKPKAAIPSWQRALQPSEPSSTTTPSAGPSGETNKDGAPRLEETTPAASSTTNSEAAEAPGAEESAEESVQIEENAGSQLDMVDAFLQDPAVKNEPVAKKRAFLESKSIPKERIDEALSTSTADSRFNTNDFDAFKQRVAPRAAPTTQQKSAGPPIITYPEFLVDAHKPPPLITPGRIVNTAYIAGALAFLTYGASKYLISPMTQSLTEARHDFSEHSQSKLDEFNDRLGKIVSRQPEPKKAQPEADVDDVDSITSDPTELYHRDMGTQTSPELSREASSDSSNPVTVQKDTVTKHEERLKIINSHFNELISGAGAVGDANKDRQDSVNSLRHYLDNLLYGSVGSSVWEMGANGQTVPGVESKKGENNAIEELKKEIRGVKGVLLSAKRFPSAVGRVGA